MGDQDVTRGRLRDEDVPLLPRRVPGAAVTAGDLAGGPSRGLVPVPRRSRVFLRHGGGHGSFAALTLVAPLARPLTH